MPTEETEPETEEIVTEEPVELVTPADDDEPPAWFVKLRAREAADAAAAKPKTVARPAKTAAPAKKTAAAKVAETPETEETPKRKRSGVSRAWFGGRADS